MQKNIHNLNNFIAYYLEKSQQDTLVHLYKDNFFKRIIRYKFSYNHGQYLVNYQIFSKNILQNIHDKIVFFSEDKLSINDIKLIIMISKFASCVILRSNKIYAKQLHNELIKSNIRYLSDYNDLLNDDVVTVMGKDINFFDSIQPKKILGIICTYNEEDIIFETINHLLNQGLHVCVIDDASTDDTWKKLNIAYQNNRNIILRQRDKNPDFKLFDILKLKEKIAIEQSDNYDWFMHLDSDEIRESPFKDISMKKYISFVDSLGYNAIDFTVVDFRFDLEYENFISDYEQNLHYLEFGRRPGHFAQIKCWKKQNNFQLAGTGGHNVKFDEIKVYPIKFLLKHYPYRNNKQMNTKLFKDRASRIDKANKERGWHGHYLIHMNNGLKWDISSLIDLHSVNFDTDYLFERISGVGIERE